ncbi:MAG: protein kinase [Proteobacteria bacterium]|nr:protein kinase [Pseudomonadota bacterium]
MSTDSLPSLAVSNGEPQSGEVLERARGLAQLAFGSFSHVGELTVTRHLALLPAESLELDLSDPAQRQFGDYELLEHLDEGGMGVVYRARQVSLDREVALKLLSAGPWASKDFIARFEREAQNAARMQHPNIVAVYEVGNLEGLQFYSMRLVRGMSLSSKLRQGERFTPKAAAALMRTVAEAMDYAHSLGVLHLDLKPGNVLLDEAGTPYVSDFGLARRLENTLAIENDEVSGTPAYMAPEQAQVRAYMLTAATDIWGLGAILYELLTGQPPFRAGTAEETVKLVREGKVRAPRRLQPALPLDLEAIVTCCLRRDPAGRYPTARALAEDLARYVEGRPVQARPLNAAQRFSRWSRREPKVAVSLACAILVLVIGLIATTTQLRRADASADAARENLWAVRAQTAQQALAQGDGFHSLRPLIASLTEMEAAGRTDRAMIERERIGTILANAPQLVGFLQLPDGELATSVAISPDAHHFAIATIERHLGGTRRVRQYDLAGLRQTWVTSTDNRTFLMAGGDRGVPNGGLRYTADGRFLLVSVIEQAVIPAPRRSDMIAFDARDGRALWPQGLPMRQTDIVYDDSARLALVRYRSNKSWRWPDSGQFYEVAGWKPVGPLHTRATTLAADLWLPAPGGTAWLGTRDSARIALYDVPSLKPRWQLSLPQTSLVRAWQFSHDGRLIALGSVDGAVRLVDAANGQARQFTTAPAARVQSVEFGADDRTLAAIDENGQFWTWDVATGAARSAPLDLLRGGISIAQIRYNGDMLFGGGVHDSDAELAYVTLAPRSVLNNEAVPGATRLPSPSPLGNAFDVSASAHRMVTANNGGLIEIWRLPDSPLLAARAAPLPSQRLTFDGTQVVATDGNTVRMIDTATGAPRSPPLRHPEPVRFAELSPDGRALVTIAGRTVRVIDPGTWKLRGAPVVLPQTPERVVFAQAAPVLVLTTAEYTGDVRRERIYRVDLAKGVLLDTYAKVDAIEQFKVDPQGGHALIMTVNTATHDEAGPFYLALDSGHASCRPALDGVRSFAFAPDGRSAWFDVALNGQSSLRRWDLEACRELAAHDRRQRETATPALFARGDGGVVAYHAGSEALLLVDSAGRREAALGQGVPDTMYDFALTADGSRAAFATRNAVYLIDARQGRRLSAPLTAPITGDDAIIALAFSPGGTRLLARTINGRWLFWELPRSELDVETLTRLARILDPIPADAPSVADLTALRIQLRKSDPAAGSTELSAGIDAPRMFADVAGAQVDPRFAPLDLHAAINVPLVGVVWPEPAARGDRPTLAPGLQRFLGVDYRIDGGVQLIGGGTATALGPELHRSAVVAVPDVIARRVHVLAFMHIPMNGNEPSRAFAEVVLIGADGHETRLEIRTVRDVATDVGPDAAARSARVAFAGVSSAFARGGVSMDPGSDVYAVALDVPAKTGPIRGLRFDVPDGPMEAPLLYAATLERADDSPVESRTSPATIK